MAAEAGWACWSFAPPRAPRAPATNLYADALNDPLLKRTKVELDAAMANAVEARKVVFELFQDLDGFRLDDYKAMGSPEEGMGALVRFVTGAASAEADTFTSRGDKLFAWIDGDTKTETLLTTERELSLQKEKVQLLGLDHPVVTAYLRKFRNLPPEHLGVRVQSPDGHSGVLAVWAIEARGDKGQVKRVIVPLAVDTDGKRLLPWERHPENLWHAQPSSQNGANSEKMLALLRETLGQCCSASLNTGDWPTAATASRPSWSAGWKPFRNLAAQPCPNSSTTSIGSSGSWAKVALVRCSSPARMFPIASLLSSS
jgi:hypothetical protein